MSWLVLMFVASALFGAAVTLISTTGRARWTAIALGLLVVVVVIMYQLP